MVLKELDENAEEKLEGILDDNRVDGVILSIKYEDEILERQVILTKYETDEDHLLKLRDSLDEKIEENEG